MTQMVRLPDSLFARLQAHATPFVDTPADVIERMVDFYERNTPPAARTLTTESDGSQVEESPGSSKPMPSERAPRERGMTIRIDDRSIEAISVRDMYEKALRLLVDNGHMDLLKEVVPFRTSAERYLVSNRPVHPNGRDFVVPVEYGGFYMEAHKDYRNGTNHLRRLVEKCGLSFNDRV